MKRGRRMKKMFIRFVLGIMTCLCLLWACSLIRCEVLTYLHTDEFDVVIDSKYDESFDLKVLEYNHHNSAKVYLISNDKTQGDVLLMGYDLENDCWQVYDYVGGWSKSGNSDDIVYPYIWHLFYCN